MTTPLKVLVVDDEAAMREVLEMRLGEWGFDVVLAGDGASAAERVEAEEPDLVISDVVLPDLTGLDLLRTLKAGDAGRPVLLVTAYGSVDAAVEAMKEGALDFLTKPLDYAKLRTVLEDVRSELAQRGEAARLAGRLGAGDAGLGELVGASRPMRQLYELVGVLAESEAAAILTGESGTGKEVVARTLHRLSPRREGPFVAVNSAALPDGLTESELFGHERGAFTGAVAARPGCFEQAHGGTLFLDEIAEMPISLQPKLLRLLEEGTVKRLGGTREIAFDVRVIAATNREPEAAVDAGLLRQDLYFRLNVFHVELPPVARAGRRHPTARATLRDPLQRQTRTGVVGREPWRPRADERLQLAGQRARAAQRGRARRHPGQERFHRGAAPADLRAPARRCGAHADRAAGPRHRLGRRAHSDRGDSRASRWQQGRGRASARARRQDHSQQAQLLAMKVATKIIISSVLLAVALGSVVVYQAVQARGLTEGQRTLLEEHSRAQRLLQEQRQRFENLTKDVDRLAVRRDADYETRVDDLAETFTEQLKVLQEFEEPEDLKPAIANLTRLWTRLRPILLPPDYLEVHGPEIRERYELETAKLNAAIDVQLSTAMRVIQVASGELVDRLTAQRREDRRISIGVLLGALAVSALIVALTVRSINRPLARLVEGTRAVAGGDFEVRFESERNDEFARLARALDRMAQRLGEIDRLKKDFMAHVSHELKTPLVAMQETNQLLLDELPGPLTNKQRRLLELNLSGGRRLSAMLSNLLDLSRLEAGVVEYDKKSHDLRDVAELVADEFAARARELGLRIRLSSPAEPVMGEFDRDRVIQVVENLVDNALKFSPQGSVVGIEVKTSAEVPKGAPRPWRRRWRPRRRSSMAILSVTDSGPGVPEGRREWIFRRFHQLRRPPSGGAGVGLGLAICREIVLAHGGALWVDSRPEGGSVFRLLLPASTAAPLERLSA